MDVRRMYSNIAEMDHQVGEILRQLEEDGLMDSTIVVWYTDHGGPLPRQKRLLYDSGIKVPMIIRFPGQQFAGQRDDRMISFIDLAATNMSLAGLQPPQYMDGSAFLGKYIREVEPEVVFGAADRFDEKYDAVRSVRSRDYKYIKYYMPEKPMLLDVAYRNQMPIMQELHRMNEAGELSPDQALWFRETKPDEELFNITKDPFELNNLADDPAYADVLTEMRQACTDWVKSIDDTGLMDEKVLLARIQPEGVTQVTLPPVISRQNGMVTLTSDTDGASIGYRLQKDGLVADSLSWTVYVKPFEVEEGEKVIAVADRIGFDRSKIVQE
jgi:arylsulfatase A-like enzyme